MRACRWVVLGGLAAGWLVVGLAVWTLCGPATVVVPPQPPPCPPPAPPATYSNDSNSPSRREPRGPRPGCQAVHVAMVVVGSNATRGAVTVLKSILAFRTAALHLHWVTDAVTEPTLRTIMTSWALSNVTSLYHSIEKVFF